MTYAAYDNTEHMWEKNPIEDRLVRPAVMKRFNISTKEYERCKKEYLPFWAAVEAIKQEIRDELGDDSFQSIKDEIKNDINRSLKITNLLYKTEKEVCNIKGKNRGKRVMKKYYEDIKLSDNDLDNIWTYINERRCDNIKDRIKILSYLTAGHLLSPETYKIVLGNNIRKIRKAISDLNPSMDEKAGKKSIEDLFKEAGNYMIRKFGPKLVR